MEEGQQQSFVDVEGVVIGTVPCVVPVCTVLGTSPPLVRTEEVVPGVKYLAILYFGKLFYSWSKKFAKIAKIFFSRVSTNG